MILWAAGLAIPVAEIAGRILVKGGDKVQSTVDREMADTCVCRIARVETRPAEKIFRVEVLWRWAVDMRSEAEHLVDLVFGKSSGVAIVCCNRARELQRLGGIQGNDAVVRSAHTQM